MKLKSQLMDEAAMNRALMRISHEIAEKNKGVEMSCSSGYAGAESRLPNGYARILRKSRVCASPSAVLT